MTKKKEAENYKKYCIGCGLCSSKCGETLVDNQQGYLAFVEPIKAETVEFCNEVCPVSENSLLKLDEGSMWGKKEAVYLGFAEDSELRKRASSGGVLSALAVYLLESKKVDGIIHVCEDSEYPLGTVTCISTTPEEVRSRCGSRYAISHPMLDMWEKMEPDKKYCFIGKPCDATALSNYLEKDQNQKKQFPYIFSFFCAGLPSKQANEKLVTQMGCKVDECTSMTYRGNGWPGYATVHDKSGRQFELDYDTAWGHILGRDIHPFCRFCMDGIGERADISCGDAWYQKEDGQPDFSEKEGRNVIFARSKIGAELIAEAMEAGYLSIEHLQDEGMLDKIQKYQYTRKSTMTAKILACRVLLQTAPYRMKGRVKKYRVLATKGSEFKILRGSLKRVLQGKM